MGVISDIGAVVSSIVNWNNNEENNRQQREIHLQDQVWAANQAAQANDWSIAQWNRENEYNSPAAQMKRLKDAGINPALAYSNGLFNQAATSPDVKVPENGQRANTLPWQSDPMLMASLEKTNAETELLRSQSENVKSETKGKEIQNEIDGMNFNAFKDSYEQGLVHDALSAGFGQKIDDASLTRYTLCESAWNFALLTGVSLVDSYAVANNIHDKTFTDYSIPFSYTEEAFKRAQRLYISGTEAQSAANDAARLVANAQKEQKQKDFNIWHYINKLTESKNKWERTLGYVAQLGLFIAEQRFSLPSFNLNIDSGKKFNYFGFAPDSN